MLTTLKPASPRVGLFLILVGLHLFLPSESAHAGFKQSLRKTFRPSFTEGQRARNLQADAKRAERKLAKNPNSPKADKYRVKSLDGKIANKQQELGRAQGQALSAVQSYNLGGRKSQDLEKLRDAQKQGARLDQEHQHLKQQRAEILKRSR